MRDEDQTHMYSRSPANLDLSPTTTWLGKHHTVHTTHYIRMKYCGFGCQNSCGYPRRIRMRSSDTPLPFTFLKLLVRMMHFKFFCKQSISKHRTLWIMINFLCLYNLGNCRFIAKVVRYCELQMEKQWNFYCKIVLNASDARTLK